MGIGTFINNLVGSSNMKDTMVLTEASNIQWRKRKDGLGRIVTVNLPKRIETYGSSELRRLKDLQKLDNGQITETVARRLGVWLASDSVTDQAIATIKSKVRWAAAGVIPRITDVSTKASYFMFVERTDGRRLGAYAGHSASIDELLDPVKLQQREFLEEGIIYHKNDIILPVVGDMTPQNQKMVRDMRHGIGEKVLALGGSQEISYTLRPGKIKGKYNLDNVKVFVGGELTSHIQYTNAFWNPMTAGVDITTVLDLGELEINELRVFDTEYDNKGNPLKRNHVLVPEHLLIGGSENEDPWLNKCRVLNGFQVEGGLHNVEELSDLATVDNPMEFAHYKLGSTASYVFSRLKN
jgi:hypothetical protein